MDLKNTYPSFNVSHIVLFFFFKPKKKGHYNVGAVHVSVHEMRSDLRHCSRGVHQDENPTGPNKKVV